MSADDLVTAADAQTSIDLARGHLADAGKEIVWQVRNKVWRVLGYVDWDEMREAEYGGAAVIVPRADRPELVAALHSEGLSQQSIGDTFGISQQTVGRDVIQMDNTPAQRIDSLGRQQPTSKPRPQPSGVESQREDPSTPEPGPAPDDSSGRGETNGPPADDADDQPDPGVTAYLDSDDGLAAKKYAHAFATALADAVKFREFDAERVAAVCTDSVLESLDDLPGMAERFAAEVRKARSGMRLVHGGRA